MSMAVNVQELLFNQDKEWQKSDSYILYFPLLFFVFLFKEKPKKNCDPLNDNLPKNDT